MFVVEDKPARTKTRWSFIILLGVVLVTVAVWLSLGLGGQLIGDYLKQQYVKTTHGLAKDSSEIDPHVEKVFGEYESLIDLAESQNPAGIYERVHAGDYSYEKLEPEQPGQFTIEATIIFDDIATAEKVYKQALDTLTSIGYEQDPDLDSTETSSEVIRLFNAADENSVGAPGDDRIVIQYGPVKDKARMTFFYTGTEIPLGTMPYEEEEITVAEFNKTVEKVVSGEIDICDYEPNGILGGWYSEYECMKDYL